MADPAATGSGDPPRGSPPAPDPPLDAVYANQIRVGYTPTEFVLDFCHLLPPFDGQPPPAKVASRVVLAPPVAAQLLLVLRDAATRYGHGIGGRDAAA